MKKTISIMLTVLIVMVMLATTVISSAAATEEELAAYRHWLGEISDEEYNALVSPSYENTDEVVTEQDAVPIEATAKYSDVTATSKNSDIAEAGAANQTNDDTSDTITVDNDKSDTTGNTTNDTDKIIENDTDDIITNDVVPDKTNDDDKTTGDTDKVEDATEPSTKEDTVVTETTAETTASTEAPTVPATTAKSNTLVKTNNPKTGDSVWIIVSLLTAAVLGASVLVIYRKRAKSK